MLALVAVEVDLAPDAADIMVKVAESVVLASGLYPTIAAKVPIVEPRTDELLVLAWDSLEAVAKDHGRAFTGVQMKRMLAILVAATWHGAAAVERLDHDLGVTTERVGKRLHKQVFTVQRQLKDISSKASRERASLPVGSEEQNRVDAREQQALACLKRQRHAGITELLNAAEAAAVEEAAPAEAAPAEAAGLSDVLPLIAEKPVALSPHSKLQEAQAEYELSLIYATTADEAPW